jgi:hypothetical protein
MPDDINNWDIKSLNQLFLQLSRDFRDGLKSGQEPQELKQLQVTILKVHHILRSKRFNYNDSTITVFQKLLNYHLRDEMQSGVILCKTSL